MPNPYLIVFELLLYLLLVLCVRHAWPRGLHVVGQLLAGVLFGVLLEWATIQQLHAYEYGRFLVMFGEVPLAIGVGWGVIIYSARLVSDATSLKPWQRPLLDALLALNIDLAMDAVAIRLGMWEWGIDLDAQYFGVPYANFWAWFWVIFSFSMGLQLAARRESRLSRWIAPPAAIVVGVLGTLTTNRIITAYVPGPLLLPVVALVIGGALALVLFLRPRFRPGPMPRVAFLVPATFHLYFLAAGLAAGILFRMPFLLVVSVLMTAMALLVHLGVPGHGRG